MHGTGLRVVAAGVAHYVTQRGNRRQPVFFGAAIRAGERTGRSPGSAAFTATLEKSLGRQLTRRKPGPKPKAPAAPPK